MQDEMFGECSKAYMFVFRIITFLKFVTIFFDLFDFLAKVKLLSHLF